MLDARDADDDPRGLPTSGDLIIEIVRSPTDSTALPELVGTFTVLLVENMLPEAPLHDRLLKR